MVKLETSLGTIELKLDETAARMLQKTLEAKGLKFRLSAQTETLLGEGHVTAVRLKDGETIPAELVVMVDLPRRGTPGSVGAA